YGGGSLTVNTSPVEPDEYDRIASLSCRSDGRLRVCLVGSSATEEGRGKPYGSGRSSRPVRRLGCIQGLARRQEDLFCPLQADVGHYGSGRPQPRSIIRICVDAAVREGKE